MDPVWHAVLGFAGAAGAVAVTTGTVTAELRRRAILDLPNHRSSHAVPTPRGGGLGVTPVVLLAWAILASLDPAGHGMILIIPAALGLTLVSWLDDLKDLPAAARLIVQAAAVAVGLAALPADALVFQGMVPVWLDRAAAGFAWLWFVNLFNFMDGIDGISGTELACVGLGLAVAALLAGSDPALAAQAAVLAGGGLGFLVWNWHPARVFLGDVGSVPLGYLLGSLLIAAAAAGLWLPALILPLYYLADATLTLLRRLLRGERVWQAHREHFYQQAVRRGLGHAAVVRRILLGNLVLVGSALASLYVGIWALIPAVAAVLLLLVHLAGPALVRRKGWG